MTTHIPVSGHLVTVATAYSVSEAQVIQSMLRAYGIVSFLFDGGMINIDPGLAVALGGIKINVPAEEAETALELIWDGRDEREPPRSYSERPAKNGFAAILLALFGVPSPARVPLQPPDSYKKPRKE